MVVSDSVADSSIMEFQNIGLHQIEWDKFNSMSSYAKAFTKSKGNSLEKISTLYGLVYSSLARWLEEAASGIKRGNRTRLKAVSANEFFVFLGIIIISGAVGKGGKSLFKKDSDRLKDGIYRLSPAIDRSPYMSMRQFEDIKSYFPQAFADFDKANPREDNHDPWYMFSKYCRI
jgi:hypothetical protein